MGRASNRKWRQRLAAYRGATPADRLRLLALFFGHRKFRVPR